MAGGLEQGEQVPISKSFSCVIFAQCSHFVVMENNIFPIGDRSALFDPTFMDTFSPTTNAEGPVMEPRDE